MASGYAVIDVGSNHGWSILSNRFHAPCLVWECPVADPGRHKFEVLVNHVVELVVPWGLLLVRRVCAVSGLVQVRGEAGQCSLEGVNVLGTSFERGGCRRRPSWRAWRPRVALIGVV